MLLAVVYHDLLCWSTNQYVLFLFAFRNPWTIPRPAKQSTGLFGTPAMPEPGCQISKHKKENGHPFGCPFLVGEAGLEFGSFRIIPY